MHTQRSPSPRFTGTARFDVTDCEADDLSERARANDVNGANLYLERRGGKTYLVADRNDS